MQLYGKLYKIILRNARTVSSLLSSPSKACGEAMCAHEYASRRSRMRDTVKLAACVCIPAVTLNGCNATKTNRLL